MRLNRMIGGRTIAAVVAVAFGVLLSGASANAADTLRVAKGFPSLFQFTPLDVGVEKGIFKKHGLDVEVSAFAGDAKLQQAFAAGAVDMGIGSGPGMAFWPTPIWVSPRKRDPRSASRSPCWPAARSIRSPISKASSPAFRIPGLGQTDWMVRELGRREGWGAGTASGARRACGATRRHNSRRCGRIRSIWRRSTSPPLISSKRQARCAFS